MNRRLNLTSLPDELLMKIMQGGPTTCDGIPSIQVKVMHFVAMSTLQVKIEINKGTVRYEAVKIEDDLLKAMRRDVAKYMIKPDKTQVEFGWVNPLRQFINADIKLPEVPKAKFEAMVAQASTRFLGYIATALEKIGKKYGLHVRDGRARGTAAAVFYLCEGGKLAQASRGLHRLR